MRWWIGKLVGSCGRFGMPMMFWYGLVAGCATAGELTTYLEGASRQLLAGCQVDGPGRHRIYTPDGSGNYRALWTRDFSYMVEGGGDLLPLGEVEACLDILVGGIRDDGAAPDRVRPDGVAVYTAGGEDHPLGEPNIDNAQFLVIAADVFLRRLPEDRRKAIFRAWSRALDRSMDYIPRAESGLVWNDPERPHSPYGFTDTVGKTGELLMESLLYWKAAKRLEGWHTGLGDAARGREYGVRAGKIEGNLGRLWDEKAGAFRAADRDCRQLDIWGNAYALWIDVPLGERRDRVLDFLVRERGRYLWKGQVRHLLNGEYWERLLVPVARDRYQNGAYWATASGWVASALALRDPLVGRACLEEMVADFRSGGICECVHEGYRQLPGYVVSAVNPLVVARHWGW